MIISHRNTNIYYTSKGKGKTLVLLHGFLETITMWDNFIDDLAKTHHVICIDLLGHGKTECIGYIHTMLDMADAVFAVLKAEKVSKIKCVGHSMGGYVALALAEKHPEIFTSLCLMNSSFEADNEERKMLRERANKMVKHNFENLVRMSFSNLFAPESKQALLLEFNNALELALQTPLQGYIAAQEGMRLRPNRFNVFKNLKAKKAIIISEKDWIINAELLKSKTQNLDVEIVEFSEGHMSHIENKSELSYFFSHFIEK